MKRLIASCAASAAVLYGCDSPNGARSLPIGVALNGVSSDVGHVQEILYVGDGDQDEIHSYNYETGAHNGALKFLSDPQGQCVDAKGNLFVPNSGVDDIVEYRRGEAHPMKTFKTTGSPVDCSVAPNGDLAVANSNTRSGSGDVDIFKRAQGKPASYSNAACPLIGAAGYDGSGNLYVQGGIYSTSTRACELPAGSSAMRAVTLNVTILGFGGVMWDGQNITMASDCDSSCSGTVIYQMQEDTSGNLTKVGETVLATDGCQRRAAIRFPFILGKVNTPENRKRAVAVVGGSSGSVCDRVAVWKYPQGGNPIRTITISKINELNGQSVSIAR